jgi:hypothetical protein
MSKNIFIDCGTHCFEGFEDFDSADIYEVFYNEDRMPDYSSKMKVKVIAEMRKNK